MPEEHLPIYEIQDFSAQQTSESYFYLNTFAAHLQEHLFIQKPHRHNFYIILFITQGSGTHTIDFKEYTVTPGTVFFLSPGQVHSWQLSDDTDGFILFFSPEFYLLEYPHKKLFSYPFFHVLLKNPVLTLLDVSQEPVLNLIKQLQQEQQQQLFMKDDVLRNYLDILLIYLARSYRTQYTDTDSGKAGFQQVQLLESLINEHYKTHQPVSFYADQLHLTPKQLNGLSKNSTGKTITELLQDRLILEAQRLLVHSPLTVTQVAAELGYFDNAYFFRFFKKHVGQTPEQFRNAHS